MTGKLQDHVAYRIRAELVCCDIYDRIQQDARTIDQSADSAEAEGGRSAVPSDFGMQGAMGRAIIRKDWHDLCYWGEAAARIAEGRCPGYETDPNICRCGCQGCAHNCSAHTEWIPKEGHA